MDWRDIGGVSQQKWEQVLQTYGSPFARKYDPYTAAKEHSALCLAQLLVESQGGTTGRLIDYNNPLGLRPGPYGWANGNSGTIDLDGAGKFLTFMTVSDCIRQWYARITNPSYKNGVYAKTKTLDEYITVYAPPSENDTAAYIKRVKLLLTEWGKDLEGDEPVPTGIPVHQQIIPVSAAHRPGTKLTANWAPYGITVHETGDPRRGANAQALANYLSNGAEGRTVGWHLTVDDKGIFQHIPLDEMGYHASDGADNSNLDEGAFGTVAIETCINADGDFEKAKRNLAEVIARIEAGDAAFNWGAGGTRGKFTGKEVSQHYRWAADKKNCPEKMRNAGTVPQNGIINTGPLYDMIEEERRRWGSGSPSPVVEIVPGMTFEQLKALWAPTVPDLNGPVFKAYVDESKKTGMWTPPDLNVWGKRDGNATYWRFQNGLTIWRPDTEPNVRVLR